MSARPQALGRSYSGGTMSIAGRCFTCGQFPCVCGGLRSGMVAMYGAPSPPSYPDAFQKPSRVEPVSSTLEAISPGLLSYLEALKAQLTELTAKVDALAAPRKSGRPGRFQERMAILRKYFGSETFCPDQAASLIGISNVQTSHFLLRMVSRGLIVKKFRGAYQVAP